MNPEVDCAGDLEKALKGAIEGEPNPEVFEDAMDPKPAPEDPAPKIFDFGGVDAAPAPRDDVTPKVGGAFPEPNVDPNVGTDEPVPNEGTEAPVLGPRPNAPEVVANVLVLGFVPAFDDAANGEGDPNAED